MCKHITCKSPYINHLITSYHKHYNQNLETIVTKTRCFSLSFLQIKNHMLLNNNNEMTNYFIKKNTTARGELLLTSWEYYYSSWKLKSQSSFLSEIATTTTARINLETSKHLPSKHFFLSTLSQNHCWYFLLHLSFWHVLKLWCFSFFIPHYHQEE